MTAGRHRRMLAPRVMADATRSYPALEGLRVIDVMHAGLISCSPDTPLRTVARMMTTYRVHAVLVMTHGDEKLGAGATWGIVSDADLLRAAETADLDEQTAGSIAAATVLTVATTDDLAAAAAVMVAQGASHVIVGERHSSRPVGVLSTLDLARAFAGFPERHPAPF
jgi:CBS domain-containing protein